MNALELLQNKVFKDAVANLKQTYIDLMVYTKEEESDLRNKMHTKLLILNDVVGELDLIARQGSLTKEQQKEILKPSRLKRLLGKRNVL